MNMIDFVQTIYPERRIDCGSLALGQVVSACRQLERQHGRKVDVAELSEALILSHMRWMREKKMSTATINRRRVHFLTVWKVAYKAGVNQNDYFRSDIPPLRNTISKPVAWSISDIGKMIAAAEMLNKYILKPAELPNNRHLKFHAIRKTVATYIAATQGKDVARDALGHSDNRTTDGYIADAHSVDPTLPPRFSPVDVMPKIG